MLLNARVCLAVLHCLICIFGGLRHFPFSFSKLMGFFIQGNNLEKENGKWQRPQWESRINSHIFFLNLVQFRSLLVKHFYKVAWYAGFGRTKNFTRSDLKSKEHILLPLKRGKSWFLFYLKIYDFNCLLQGPSFILHKLYNTEWSNWSTFGRHRPLVATSCSCLCGAETRCQCLKEVGSMHSVGASSVHSSIFSYCWFEYHHNIFITNLKCGRLLLIIIIEVKKIILVLGSNLNQ